MLDNEQIEWLYNYFKPLPEKGGTLPEISEVREFQEFYVITSQIDKYIAIDGQWRFVVTLSDSLEESGGNWLIE